MSGYTWLNPTLKQQTLCLYMLLVQHSRSEQRCKYPCPEGKTMLQIKAFKHHREEHAQNCCQGAVSAETCRPWCGVFVLCGVGNVIRAFSYSCHMGDHVTAEISMWLQQCFLPYSADPGVDLASVWGPSLRLCPQEQYRKCVCCATAAL